MTKVQRSRNQVDIIQNGMTKKAFGVKSTRTNHTLKVLVESLDKVVNKLKDPQFIL